MVPPVNVMAEVNMAEKSTMYFPLPLCHCQVCNLTQIGVALERSIVFPKNYPYVSGTTKSLVNNFEMQSKLVHEQLSLSENDLVIDIGSNDGSLLKNYKRYCRVLGVEPTQAAERAVGAGVDTLNQFFDALTVEKILTEVGLARVVTACNVFAHISNLDDLMKNIKAILRDDGVFISESHYFLNLVQTLQFDTIYHEHLRYYTVSFLKILFEKYDLEIFRVQYIETHGGSIRVWTARTGQFGIDSSVNKALQEEQRCGISEIDSLNTFASRVKTWRQDFRKLISTIRLESGVIGALGAPSRASTLLTYTGLSADDLIAVGEVENSSKIGRVMPGTKIPIIEERQLVEMNPTHLLILSWHIKDVLMKSARDKGFKGKFIVPLPNPVIYGESGSQ